MRKDSVDSWFEQWREALIRKSASRLLEVVNTEHITEEEGQAFTRSLLDAYDQLLKE